MNRKCGKNVATDDRRTFTDKDKMCRIQTQGNGNKDAMLDCESGFIGDTINVSLIAISLGLVSSYVTSILVTN